MSWDKMRSLGVRIGSREDSCKGRQWQGTAVSTCAGVAGTSGCGQAGRRVAAPVVLHATPRGTPPSSTVSTVGWCSTMRCIAMYRRWHESQTHVPWCLAPPVAKPQYTPHSAPRHCVPIPFLTCLVPCPTCATLAVLPPPVPGDCIGTCLNCTHAPLPRAPRWLHCLLRCRTCCAPRCASSFRSARLGSRRIRWACAGRLRLVGCLCPLDAWRARICASVR